MPRSSSLANLLEELYASPLDTFIATRDAFARDLQRAGDVAGAAEMKRRRKPSTSAWAVNQLYRADRASFDALLSAGSAAKRAQTQLGKPEGLASMREALKTQRDAIARLGRAARGLLAGEGHGATPTTLSRVRRTLLALAAKGSFRPHVPGQLSDDVEPPGFAVLDDVAAPAKARREREAEEPEPEEAEEAAPARPAAKARRPKQEAKRERREVEHPARRERRVAGDEERRREAAAAERRAAAAAKREAAEAERRAAAAAKREAAAARAEAKRKAAAVKQSAAAATREAAARRRAAARARKEVAARRRELEKAEREAERAARRVDEKQRALEEAEARVRELAADAE